MVAKKVMQKEVSGRPGQLAADPVLLPPPRSPGPQHPRASSPNPAILRPSPAFPSMLRSGPGNSLQLGWLDSPRPGPSPPGPACGGPGPPFRATSPHPDLHTKAGGTPTVPEAATSASLTQSPSAPLLAGPPVGTQPPLLPKDSPAVPLPARLT